MLAIVFDPLHGHDLIFQASITRYTKLRVF